MKQFVLLLVLSTVVGVLSACTTDPETVPEPALPIVTPHGAFTATFSAECASSPACVCSLPVSRRPAKLVTPEAILKQYPNTPKELDYACSN